MGASESLDKKSTAVDVVKNVLGDEANGEEYLKGKVALVTGANSGIGKETARGLAHAKATVYLACRDEDAGQATVAELVTDTGNNNVHYINLDLGSQESIQEFARRFRALYSPLHILVNNAAAPLDSTYSETKDGVETQFGVGHVGHFLLTNLLLEKLQQSQPARIVNLSASFHKKVKFSVDKVPQAKDDYNQYGSFGLAKYAAVLFSKSLNRKYAESGVTSYAVSPGTVNTRITRNSIFHPVLSALNPLLKSPEQGASTPVYCAIHPDALENAGGYFENCAVSSQAESGTDDEKLQDELWSKSEILSGMVESPDAEASYKLIYFTVGGRGEAIRLIFAAARQDYEDMRYPLRPDFNHDEMLAEKQKFPDNFPFGQLPVLEYNKKHTIAQSHAIERFLGERLDLFGANDIEMAIIDGIGEACQDIFDKYINSCIFTQASPEEKRRATKSYYDNYFQKATAPFEKMASENPSGWIVGDKESIADLQVYYYCLILGPPKRTKRALRKSPGLLALKGKVEELPGVAKYLRERPKTWDINMFQRTEAEASEVDYKFTYFAIGGRGECSRLLFAAAEVDFQDNRYPMSETFEHKAFEEDKKEHSEWFPFGQLPTLEVDGEIVAQSHSIERFLAAEFDLFGDGDVQTAVIDGIGEACQDIFGKLLGILLGSDDGKDAALEKHYAEFLPNACKPLERLLEESGSGYIVGDSLTIADVQTYYYVLFCNRPGKLRKALKDCPRLLELKNTVEQHSGIAKYLRVRPPTWDVALWQGPPEVEEEKKKEHSFVLNYFNIGGRGEAIRLLFAAVEHEYQEVQWPMQSDFNHDAMIADREKNPDSYPYGQLPTLEVDGELLAQSHAIERYLAEEFGLLGSNDVEAALIDAAGEHVNDIFSKYTGILFSPPETHAEKLADHYDTFLPKKLAPLEVIAKENGTGWIVGDKLSVADLQFYYYVQSCNRQDKIDSILNDHPCLKALKDKVEAVPGISKYKRVRPHTFDVDMFQGTLAAPEEPAKPDKPEKFSLYYFDLRARAECARCLFAAAGQSYEDNRWPIEQGTFKHTEMEEDKKLNPDNYPFGQLPVLDVDGSKIAQSHTIERYLGETFGLVGKSDIDMGLIDSAGEHANDIFKKYLTIIFGAQGDEQTKAMGEFYSGFFVEKMKFLEDTIQKNGGTGFIVGDSLTLADIQVWYYCLSVGGDAAAEAVKEMPGLVKLNENVESNTGIKSWLAVRPDSFF